MRQRVALRIDKEQKRAIEEYVDEIDAYPSVSDFIRYVALKEVRKADENTIDTTEVKEEISQIRTEVTSLAEEIHSFKGQLRAEIQRLSEEDAASKNINSLAREVFDLLPEVPPPNSAEIMHSDIPLEALESRQVMEAIHQGEPTTLEDIATELGEDKEDVREAINLLKSNFLPVNDIVDEAGNKHYCKRGERR